jgi:hypothetical protein
MFATVRIGQVQGPFPAVVSAGRGVSRDSHRLARFGNRPETAIGAVADARGMPGGANILWPVPEAVSKASGAVPVALGGELAVVERGRKSPGHNVPVIRRPEWGANHRITTIR